MVLPSSFSAIADALALLHMMVTCVFHMRVPFPALTDLDFTGPDWEHGKDVYDISNNFLGNAAPCLQHLHLDGMSFHGLPDLLLSTRSLVSLQVRDIEDPEF